jgi:small neutral amino acid transporter SnatA (MarC family)
MALLAVGVNLLIMAAAFVFLAGYLSKLSDRAIGIFTRFAGLVVATIRVQLAFNGIKSFFELSVSNQAVRLQFPGSACTTYDA